MKDLNFTKISDQEKEKVMKGISLFYEIKPSRKKEGRGTPYAIKEKTETRWEILDNNIFESEKFKKLEELFLINNSWSGNVFYKLTGLDFTKYITEVYSSNQIPTHLILIDPKYNWVIEYFYDGKRWFIKGDNIFS